MPAPPLVRAPTANISQLTHTKLTQLGLWPSVAKFYVQCTSFVLQVQRFDEFFDQQFNEFFNQRFHKLFCINDFTSLRSTIWRVFDKRFHKFSKYYSVQSASLCPEELFGIHIFRGQVLSFSTTTIWQVFLHQRFDEICDKRFHEFLISVCTVQVCVLRNCKFLSFWTTTIWHEFFTSTI